MKKSDRLVDVFCLDMVFHFFSENQVFFYFLANFSFLLKRKKSFLLHLKVCFLFFSLLEKVFIDRLRVRKKARADLDCDTFERI